MKKTLALVALTSAAALTAACSSGAGATSAGAAEGYPQRSVTFINPYAAGGPSDTTARAYGACLGKALGTAFAVENKVGGGGAVAMQALLSAKPDGYTVALSTNGPLVMGPIKNNLPYSVDSFRSMGTMAAVSHMIVVPANSKYKDIESLLAAAKAKPGTVSIAVPGATDTPAMELLRFKEKTGTEFSIVPTTGSSEMITQLLGGHVDAGFINDYLDSEAQVSAKKLVMLASSGEERSEAFPDVPTLKELGYDMTSLSVYGLFAPEKLPDAIQQKLESALKTCHEDPTVIKAVGDRFVPNKWSDGAATTAFFDNLKTRYEPLLKP